MDTVLNREREEEKAIAVEAIGHALLSIEMQRREPDLWEREALAYAIGALFRGGYRLAETSGSLALAPMLERSSEFAPSSDMALENMVLEKCSLERLRAAFHSACSEPLKSHPQLGPTAFA